MVAVLQWWLEMGRDFLAAIMHTLGFSPFTFRKQDKNGVNHEQHAEKPQLISPDNFKAVHQKIAHHNLE